MKRKLRKVLGMTIALILTFSTQISHAADSQAALTLTLPSSLQTGATATLSSSGGSGSGAVTYASSTTSICTVSGTTLTAVAAGTCQITVTKAADSAYLVATASGSFTVTAPAQQSQAALTLTLPSSLQTGATATLSSSGGSGSGAVTYASSTTSICTVSGTTLTAVAAGTCQITVTKAADSAYLVATASGSFTVTAPAQQSQAALTLTLPSSLQTGATATLSSSGGSGSGAVTYASSTTSICTVSGTTLTAVAAGTCQITVTKAADSAYLVATASGSFTVTAPAQQSQAALTLTLPSSLQTGATATLSSSGGSGSGAVTYASSTTSICTVSGTTLTAVAAGTCQITVTKAADSAYLVATASGSFTVTAPAQQSQAALTLTLPSSLQTGATATLSSSGGSGSGAVTYASSTTSICTVSGTTLTAVAAGTCQITVTKAADSAYLVATASGSFTVTAPAQQSQAALTLTLPSSLQTGATATLSSSGGSGSGAVTYASSTTSICTVSGTTLTAVAAGTCQITVTKAADSAYLVATASGSFTVTAPAQQSQAALTLTLPSSLQTGATATLSSSGGSGSGAVTYASSTTSICTVSGTTLTAVAAGTCQITVTKAADSAYLVATASGSFTVTAPLNDTSPPSLLASSISVTPSGVYENGTIAVSIPISDATGVQSATVTLSRNAMSVNVGDVGLTTGSFQLSRTSGTATNGTWSASSGINFGGGSSTGFLVSGIYDVTVTATDSRGLTTSVTQPALLTVGRQAGGPTLLSPTISANSIMRGQNVTVTLRVVSYMNSVTAARANISALSLSATLSRISGTSSDGVYSGIINIPATANPNSYSITGSADTFNGRTASITIASVQITAQAPTTTINLPLASSTVSSQFDVVVQGSVAAGTTGRIQFVCGTLDGAKLTGNVKNSGSGTWWSNSNANSGPNSSCYPTSSTIGSTGEFAWSLDATGLSNGTHNLSFYVVDSTGSVSPTVSRTFNVNIGVPTVSFSSPAAGSTFTGIYRVTARGSVANGSTARISFVCLKLDGSTVVSGVASSAGSGSWWSNSAAYYGPGSACFNTNSGISGSGEFAWSLDATGLSNGTHTLQIQIVDSTGKQSAPATVSFTVDTPLPTVSFSSPAAGSTFTGIYRVTARGSVANGSTARISFVCLKLDGSTVVSGVASSAGSGSWWSNSAAYYGPGSACFNTNSGISGSGEFAWSLDATGLSNGTHTLQIQIVDSTGKQSAPATVSFTVDTPLPTVSFSSPAAGSTFTGIYRVTARGSVANGSTARISFVCLKLDGSTVVSGVASSAGSGSWWSNSAAYYGPGSACFNTNSGISGSGEFAWSLDATGLSNGTHTLQIQIVDSTGKQSAPATVSFTVDTPLPTVSFSSPAAGSTFTGIYRVTARGSVANGSTARISFVCLKLDGSTVVSGVASSAGSGSWWSNSAAYYGPGSACFNTNSGISGSGEFAWSLDATGLSNGTHTLQIQIVDSTGKQSAPATVSFTVYNPPPTIQVLSPSQGGAIVAKFSIEVAISSQNGDVLVGLNAQNANPTSGYYSTTSSSAPGIPQGTTLWNARTEKSFKWEVDATTWTPGPRTIALVVIDKTNQVVTTQLNINVLSVKPTVSIVSPRDNQSLKGKVNIRAIFTAMSTAGRAIAYVGISESTAKWTSGGEYAYSNLPNRYTDFSVSGRPSNFEANWTVDYSQVQTGSREIWVAVQDTYGDITEQKISVQIEKAVPVLQIISPSQGEVIPGVITLRVNATADAATTGKINRIAISSRDFTPQFIGNNTNCRVDSSYTCWSVNDVRQYTWTSKPQAFKDGPVTLTVIAFDDSDNSAQGSINFTVSAVSPTVSINGLASSIISRSSFTFSASATPNIGSGSEIVGVAISDRTATPQFPGTLSNSRPTGIPLDAQYWSVANVKNLSWRIDPITWSEGDRVLNVFAIDSNGKLGQSSVVLHLAPTATWKLRLEGLPVLGQSVPVSVSMNTNSPYRKDVPIQVRIQTGTTEFGPWRDLGILTLDSAGTATGNVLVEQELYVRVNHEQLDAVQPGASEALRIVNVPASGSSGKRDGKRNPDGSLPIVTCSAKNLVKVGDKVQITCSAKDVQNTAQPVNVMLQQKKGSPKPLSKANVSATRITAIFNAKQAGTYILNLVGSGSGFVPWTSNNLSITVRK